MKRIRIIGLMAIAVFGLGACKKDSLNSSPTGTYQDEYRFYATAKINGLPIDFNAGEDDYGLETDYSLQDSVVIMTGTLSRINEPLKNAILLRIRSDQEVSNESEFKVEKSLRPGVYSYRDKSGYCAVPGTYDLNFFGDTIYSQATFEWTFADSSKSNLQYPPTKSVLVSEFDPFEVTMKTDYFGCQSKITHWVNIEENCDATIELSEISLQGFDVSVMARQGNVVSVDWILDNNEVQPSFSGRISNVLYGQHTLRAEIYFEEGCTKVVERTFDASAPNACLTDFRYEKSKARIYDAKQLGAVELEYYDENGKKFTSYYSGTDGDFKTVSLSPYLENEKGQKTTRFFFESNAILKNEDGSSVELTECFGSFAVSHP